MNKKVIVHIGMHKTGSSSIQETLFSALDDPAFAYADFGAANHSAGIVSMFSGAPEKYHLNQRKGLAHKEIERSNDAARESAVTGFSKSTASTVIISGEDICLLQEDELRRFRDFLAGHFEDITVVGYVRPPLSFMESIFQQYVKGGLDRLELKGLYPKYRHRFEKFDLVFGRDKVNFWKFDPRSFPRNDVVLDFCRRLGISMRSEDVRRVNESLSKEALSVLFAYRKFGPGYGVGAHAIPENNKLNAAMRVIGGERFRFSSELLTPFIDAKHQDIRWMEQRMGASLAASKNSAPDGVRSEADLLDIKVATVEALKILIGNDFLPPGIQGVTPQEVARLVQALRMKLAGERTLRAKAERRMRTVIIHFGMHKTGSSSLQQSLNECRPGGNFHYINIDGPNSSAAIRIAFQKDSRNHRMLRARGESDAEIESKGAELRRCLESELERAQGKIAILSAESISALNRTELANLRSVVAKQCDEIVAFGYIRPPKGYIESAYQQILHDGFSNRDPRTIKLADIYPSYRKRIMFFDDVFGRERVRLRLFDPAAFPSGDVVLDFCEALGLDFNPADVRRVNEGLSLPAVRLLYAYRLRRSGADSGRTAAPGSELLIERLGELEGPKLRFASALIRPLMEEHRGDIAWMEERLGASLFENLEKHDEGAVSAEADLLQFDDASLLWLARQLGAEYEKRRRPDMTPAEVAEWMGMLQQKLANAKLKKTGEKRGHVSGRGKAALNSGALAPKPESAPLGARSPGNGVRTEDKKSADSDRLKCKMADFADLDEMGKKGVPEGRFSVNISGANFECLFYRKPVERLFVLLHGARDPQVTDIPIFARWSWHDIFPGSVLYVADPTLELDPADMKIGWYVGTETNDYTGSLARLVQRVAGQLGLATSQVIAYGSSGGGFAAMMLASRLTDATAVCINPQTSVLKYTPATVARFLQLAFKEKRPEDLTPAELARLNVAGIFRQAPHAKCLYAQNVQDVRHVKLHYGPFCLAAGGNVEGGVSADGRLATFLFDDAKKHGAEPSALAPTLIAIAVELAGGMEKTGLAELLRMHSSKKDVKKEAQPDRELVQRAMKALPGSGKTLSKEQAAALVGGAFKMIAKEVGAAKDGIITFGGLGRFRVHTGDAEAKERRGAAKRIIFHSAALRK